MRKLVLILLLGAASACSPTQHAAWLNWHQLDPQAAEDWARNDCGELCTNDSNHNGIVEPDATDSQHSQQSDDSSSDSQFDGDVPDDANFNPATPCSQWASTALDAGFTESEWYSPVSWVMARESGCNPSAYNPSGASGLMQIMPMWADDCGGSPSDLFNPWFNLHCAVHIKNVQGWGAWSTY